MEKFDNHTAVLKLGPLSVLRVISVMIRVLMTFYHLLDQGWGGGGVMNQIIRVFGGDVGED